MRFLRLFIFAFYFFCFTSFGFCYTIESQESHSEQFSEQVSKILNFIFCPLNYTSNNFFLRDIERFYAKIKNIEPFDEFYSKIGFYYINLSDEEENLIFKQKQGFPPLEVSRDFLDDVSTRFKSKYKLIIIDASGSVSCAQISSIDKTSLIILGKKRYKSINSFNKGFLHEFGHSLGLRDECVACRFCPPGPPNCAISKEEAEKWWGDLAEKEDAVDYISGCCANKNYIRPSVISLMNDPEKAEDFGAVNERYLRKVLLEEGKEEGGE